MEIVKELKDPANTHKYSHQMVITVISEKLKRDGIRLDYEKGFNSYVMNLIIDFYNVKMDPLYSYKHTIGNQEQYTYSQQFVEFVYSEIVKNPDRFVESLKQRKR